ncbi:hypothetical protein D1007_43833 [Hordeum vulgare]|nr:hypothetical protein D1007_43833 [Hordeum vulgare]
MPSLNDPESSDDDISMVGMEQDLLETPDTVVDPSFCGSVTESEPKCMIHRQRPSKMVAFEETSHLQHGGVNCGVVEWVDAPCPDILQRCLARIWDMYHDHNLGRVKDKEAHEKEVAKLKKEIGFLGNNYGQLVNDVSNLFDYQDGKKSYDMGYTSQSINELKEKKKQLEDQAKIKIDMEKLKLAKAKRCIIQTQTYIIQNTRKARKEVEGEKDLLKEKRKKLEYMIAELLKAGQGCKSKLEMIKVILDE